MQNKLNLSVLPLNQRRLFYFLAEQGWLKSFYLAGGTALALQIGHRQSVDFDFFSDDAFDVRMIVKEAMKYGEFELFSEAENTLHGLLNGVQISFFKINDNLLGPTNDYNENLKLASLLDIAVMKLNAISGRGNKKDFIDLSFLLKYFGLIELLEKYEKKYGRSISNQYHLLKSLLYFADAENQPMPRMKIRKTWLQAKKEIILATKKAGII